MSTPVKRSPAGPLRAGASTIHPSIEQLLKATGVPNPEEAIRIKARQAVAHGRSCGWSGPPFDLTLLAGILGIKDRPVSDLPQDALIMPSGSGFEILWNDQTPVTRRNFTFGHEISHTFFPDCAAAIRYRGPLHRCDPHKRLEALCDVGAAELLLPFPEFRDDAQASGISLETLDTLRVRYEASREAVAMRLVGLDLAPCAIAFLTCRLKPVEARAARQLTFAAADAPTPKYRVDMMFVSESFGAERLPVHKSVPDDSCVYRAAATKTEIVGVGVADGVECVFRPS
jgi:hypothetical protein